MPTHVSYEFAGGVARISLLGADRGNAVDAAAINELLRAVRAARTAAARVIVLSSSGRYFCVGGDAEVFATVDDLPAYLDALADSIHDVARELAAADAIVVAVVQGAAVGAGFALASAADIIIAGRAAKFVIGYTRSGLTLEGGLSRLVQTLGLHRTMRLALLHDPLTAAAAFEAGLVARVVDDAELREAADEVVTGLAAAPPAAFSATKKLLRGAMSSAIEDDLSRESAARRAAGMPDHG